MSTIATSQICNYTGEYISLCFVVRTGIYTVYYRNLSAFIVRPFQAVNWFMVMAITHQNIPTAIYGNGMHE